MCVYLSSRDVGMAEHHLDRADVSTILYQMGCERMAKRVGRNVLEAAFIGVFLNEIIDDLSVQRTTCRRHKQILDLDLLLLSAGREIAFQPFDRAGADGYTASFAALSSASDDTRIEINIFYSNIYSLRDTEAAGVHQLQYGPVAQAGFGRDIRCGKQRVDLGLVEKTRQIRALLRCVEIIRRIGLYMVVDHQELVKTP